MITTRIIEGSAKMARRYEIDDAQWEQIKPFLGNTPKKTGRPQADNRKLLNGVLWIMHTGAPWRDLPECYIRGKPCTNGFLSGRKAKNSSSCSKVFVRIRICRICVLMELI